MLFSCSLFFLVMWTDMHHVFERCCSDSLPVHDFFPWNVPPWLCLQSVSILGLVFRLLLPCSRQKWGDWVCPFPVSGIHGLSLFFSCFSAFPATKGDFASFLSAGLSPWFVYSGYAKKESARAEISAGKDSSRGRFSLHPAAVRLLRSAFHPDLCFVLFCHHCHQVFKT